MNQVLDTGRFNYQKAQEHPLWYKELYGFADHKPETEEYGIRSFVYRAKRPFHPEKFYRFVNSTWPGVVRAKGHFWLATRPEWVGELSQAGALIRHQALGFWWANVPKSQWPEHEGWRKMLANRWGAVYGDRRQEIVFIGSEMDEAAIRRQLDDCLVGDANAREMPLTAWKRLPAPFPAWRRANAA